MKQNPPVLALVIVGLVVISSVSLAQTYPPQYPPQVNCPFADSRNSEGHFRSREFHIWGTWGQMIRSVWLGANLPPGVENAAMVDMTGIGTEHVEGYIEYDVADHCQGGGNVGLCAQGDLGWDCCSFRIVLANGPPVIDLPDTLLAFHDQSLNRTVSAQDADNDPVEEIVLAGYWFEENPSKPASSAPSFDGGNPGTLTWVPGLQDMGSWIFSFMAADACGAADTTQMTIRVGFPFCGDCTGDGLVDLGDVIYLTSFLYKSGPAPDPFCRGDANCDGAVNVSDVVRLINYLFRFGPLPCFDCYP
jgi:hypothetical protein